MDAGCYNNDDDAGGKPPAPPPHTLASIGSIADCDKVQRTGAGWKCLWCKQSWASWNVSKALSHLAKEKTSGMKTCTAAISRPYHDRYADLYMKYFNNRLKRKNICVAQQEAHLDHISRATSSYQSKIYIYKTSPMPCLSSMPTLPQPKPLPASIVSMLVYSPSKSTSSLSTMTNGTLKTFYQPKLISNATGQLTIQEKTNEAEMHIIIANWIHCKGFPFSTASCPMFRTILHMASNLHQSYVPPNRNEIGGKLLDENFATHQATNETSIMKEASIYGITMYGDGATIKKKPLINILAAGVHNSAAILEIKDCSGHMSSGGKKDAAYIASLFKEKIQRFESICPNVVDLSIFDGASNVQKAGKVLEQYYPRMYTIHGGEHVMSLFFKDCFNVSTLQGYVKCQQAIYKYFGGTYHKPYSVFSKHSKQHNNNRNIGVMKVAETRFAGYVIAWLRNLRLKPVFESTLTSPAFIQDPDIKVPPSVTRFLRTPSYWQNIEIIVRAFYPALKFLRFTDRATPTMDKVYYYVRQLDASIAKYKDILNSMPSTYFVSDIMFNDEIDGDSSEDSECCSDSDTDDDTNASLGDHVLHYWNKRRSYLVHDYSLTGWLLSPMKEIHNDVCQATLEQGESRLAMRRVFKKLFFPHQDEDDVIFMKAFNTLVDELRDFQNKSGPFSAEYLWSEEANQHLRDGNAHLWHGSHSLYHTKYFGKLACRITSKICGMGSAERSWGDVKTLKSGKRSHTSSASMEKQSIIYSKYCIEQSRLKQQYEINNNSAVISFEDDDLNTSFDMYIHKKQHQKRIIRCYMEDWEHEFVLKQKDCVARAKILQKYGGLLFYDMDSPFENVYEEYWIDPTQLNWEKKSKDVRGGYTIVAVKKTGSKDVGITEMFSIDDNECNILHNGLKEYYTRNKCDDIICISIPPNKQRRNNQVTHNIPNQSILPDTDSYEANTDAINELERPMPLSDEALSMESIHSEDMSMEYSRRREYLCSSFKNSSNIAQNTVTNTKCGVMNCKFPNLPVNGRPTFRCRTCQIVVHHLCVINNKLNGIHWRDKNNKYEGVETDNFCQILCQNSFYNKKYKSE